MIDLSEGEAPIGQRNFRACGLCDRELTDDNDAKCRSVRIVEFECAAKCGTLVRELDGPPYGPTMYQWVEIRIERRIKLCCSAECAVTVLTSK